MRCWLVKRGALYWDISERVEVVAHWAARQIDGYQFTDRTTARAVRDRYPNARVVRLVPKRRAEDPVASFDRQWRCRAFYSADQLKAETAKARAEEREAVARWLEDMMAAPYEAERIRDCAHRRRQP